MEKKLDNPIIVKNQDGLFQLLDDKNHTLETKAAHEDYPFSLRILKIQSNTYLSLI